MLGVHSSIPAEDRKAVKKKDLGKFSTSKDQIPSLFYSVSEAFVGAMVRLDTSSYICLWVPPKYLDLSGFHWMSAAENNHVSKNSPGAKQTQTGCSEQGAAAWNICIVISRC